MFLLETDKSSVDDVIDMNENYVRRVVKKKKNACECQFPHNVIWSGSTMMQGRHGGIVTPPPPSRQRFSPTFVRMGFFFFFFFFFGGGGGGQPPGPFSQV